MKKLIIPCLVGMLVWTALITGARAIPADHCGYRYQDPRVQCGYLKTATRGWRVYVTNDLPTATISIDCVWELSTGHTWSKYWELAPGNRGFTSSAPLLGYGYHRPLNLRCHWHRLTGEETA